MLFLEGIPLVCLEIIIGQRFKEKYLISTWRQVHPSTIGLGLSAVFVSLSVIAYFNVIVAWCVFYFVHSLQRSLPWSSCPTGSDECFNSSSPSEYYWYRTTLRASHDINSLKGKVDVDDVEEEWGKREGRRKETGSEWRVGGMERGRNI